MRHRIVDKDAFGLVGYRWIEGPELLTVHHDPGGDTGRGELWLPIERVRQ